MDAMGSMSSAAEADKESLEFMSERAATSFHPNITLTSSNIKGQYSGRVAWRYHNLATHVFQVT